MEHFVQFEDVSKYYQTGSVRIAAADHLNFYVDKGEFCIIVGPSGAGKTTLLNILGGMDTCDEGHVWLDGQDVSHFSEKELTTYRRYDVGFVFQFYNLVPNLTAIENVELAAQVCRNSLDAGEMLTKVGLADRKNAGAALLNVPVAQALDGLEVRFVVLGKRGDHDRPYAGLNGKCHNTTTFLFQMLFRGVEITWPLCSSCGAGRWRAAPAAP